VSKAIGDVVAERMRQVTEEHWSAEHDNLYPAGEMVLAGVAYALYETMHRATAHDVWPWDKSWWKPKKDARRNLIRAAALIIAEIDRIDRETAPNSGASQ
jgi:hypothetical protein